MSSYDVVIVGGGHNALVAAAYLGKAGRSVLLLERSDHLGGAAVSVEVFPGARMSRYSYLVSLLPDRIIADLNLDLTLLSRSVASYTPAPGDPTRGLLIADRGATFERIGAAADADAWADLYARLERASARLRPTLLEPLPTRAQARALVDDESLWHDVIEEPIGGLLRRTFSSDLVRGVVATDALIGTFASLEDSLEPNRCLLYHVLGGPWNVPAGGMGAVTGAMTTAARQAGAHLMTGAEVIEIEPGTGVRYLHHGREHTARAEIVLGGAAPAVLDRLLGRSPAPEPEGAQVKVNLLLRRLPRLLDERVRPEDAFAGTFHVHQGYDHLEASYADAAAGRIPDPLPLEVYCHSLTDPSILSAELRRCGAQTLTVFGLHTPDRLARTMGAEDLRTRLTEAVFDSINSVLAEPLQDVIATTPAGEPCIEVRTTADIAASLAMPGGHIFHGPLSWPFTDDDARDRPAARWGVAGPHEQVLLCGSGARRGGAVSGIGGHNAAMAALELLG